MPNDVVVLQKMVRAAAETSHSQSSGAINDLIRRLRDQLGRHSGDSPPDAEGCRFTLDLSDVHLNGLGDEVPCILLAGTTQEATEALRRFWKEVGAKEAIPFIFCLSGESHCTATRTISHRQRGNPAVCPPFRTD